MTVDKASLMKIRVFGHDRESVSQSVIPNYLIIGPFQSNVTHVNRASSRASGPNEEIGFGRREISPWWDSCKLTFTVSRKRDASTNIFTHKIGKVSKNLVLAHARSQVLQNVIDRDTEAANTGLPASFTWLDGDSVFVVHSERLRWQIGVVNWRLYCVLHRRSFTNHCSRSSFCTSLSKLRSRT
jgi:hypothetical protein